MKKRTKKSRKEERFARAKPVKVSFPKRRPAAIAIIIGLILGAAATGGIIARRSPSSNRAAKTTQDPNSAAVSSSPSREYIYAGGKLIATEDSNSASPLPDNAVFVSQTVPAAMTAGQTYNVSVNLQNTGTGTWTPAGYSLGTQNPANNTTWGTTALPSGRIAVPTNIAPGATAVFSFPVTAPSSAGTYHFQRQMWNGTQFFGALTTDVVVTVNAAGNDNASFVAQSVPTTMLPGQTYNLQVRMSNTGSTTWDTTNYKLGAQNPPNNTTWGNDIPLPSGIPPGIIVIFNFTVTAPSAPGVYHFQRQMRNGAQFFGVLTPDVVITVSAGTDDADFISQSVPTSLTPGQSANVSVVMQNSGTASWNPPNYSLGTQNPPNNIVWGSTSLPNGRVPLSASAVPGAIITFNFTIKPPSTPGTYHFQRQMWNGTQFFGDLTPDVAIVVSASSPAPTVPPNLTATAISGTSVSVSWGQSSNNPGGYVLERSTTDNQHYAQIATATQFAGNYTDSSVTASNKYFYRIKAVGSGGAQSGYSNEAIAQTPGPNSPNSPCCLQVTSFTTSSISISWAPNPGPAATGYYLEQSVNNIIFTRIADIPASQTSNTVTGLPANQNFWYRIQAYNGAPTPSIYTGPLAAHTASGPPTAPAALVVSSFTTSTISLQWQPSTNNIGYYIERSPNGTSFQQIASAGASSYFDQNLPAATDFWYRVRSFNGANVSPYSNIVHQQTAAPAPPVAPSNLLGVAVSGGEIDLTFNDNSDNESNFELQRSTSPSSGFISLAFLPAGTTSPRSFADTFNLTPLTTYYYRVRALGNGSNVFSDWANSPPVATLGYYSLLLNGSNQWLQVNSHSSLDFIDNSFTVEGWIKTAVNYNTCGATCPVQMIVSRVAPNGTATNGGYEFWVSSSGRLKFAVYRNWTHSTQITTPNNAPPLSPNSWYHVAAVFNYNSGVPANSTMSIYVNGARKVLKNLGTTDYQRGPSTSPLLIGRGTDPANTFPFNGNLDEIRVSAEAIYTDESYINWQNLSHLYVTPTTRGLWKFDFQDGRDSSPNNNTGFSQNGAQFVPDFPNFFARGVVPAKSGADTYCVLVDVIVKLMTSYV